MKEFPKTLGTNNIENFNEYNYNRLKCYLRRDLYEHIISHNQDEYFSLDKFNEERVNNLETTKKMLNELVPELEELGWKCKTSYGGTGLFIYNTEKPPSNCWEED